MGLLEDAIREHLELKRLRGADPAEVAREQQEALDASAGQEPGALLDDQLPAGETASAADEPEQAGLAAGDHPDVPDTPMGSDPSSTAQETAELDMQAVLADETSTGGDHAPPADPELDEALRPLAAEEDSLEWEVPARDPASRDEEHTGGDLDAPAAAPDERASESAAEPERGHSSPRHDAPGQGRLSL